MNRRQFLKIAGASTVLGLGGASAVNGFRLGVPAAARMSLDPRALTAKRWGFVVDVSRLRTEEDYQKCIDACHNIHNVPTFKNDLQHEVKWIWKENFEATFPGTEHEYMNAEFKEKKFLVFCNHCKEPACVRVCPTKATFKREDGIVMQDMHRCIGCRFCMAACPFGARSFNYLDPRGKNPDGSPLIRVQSQTYPTRTIGVVEKCIACYERLAIGQQPACVEASNGAILFGDLEDPNSEVRKVIGEKYTVRRKPELGTQPSIYYVIGGSEHA